MQVYSFTPATIRTAEFFVTVIYNNNNIITARRSNLNYHIVFPIVKGLDLIFYLLYEQHMLIAGLDKILLEWSAIFGCF